MSLFLGSLCHANVRIPSILGSHMVLQQNSQACFWGWANPGEKVRIMADWDSSLHQVTTWGDGRWKINIPTGKAGGPYKVMISGDNAIVLEDVMIGEVWVCSGQSNMELSGDKGLQQSIEEAPHANNQKIRLFFIPRTTATHPEDHSEGCWKVCSPEEMIHFSAIGYFFGKRLQRDLKVPVGLISSSWGGTLAETWTPEEVVMQNKELAEIALQRKPGEWRPVYPGMIYNAMIYPLTPFTIAGVIWYQGESNAGQAASYPTLFSALIKSWREQWKQDFPFYYVQIAPYDYGNNTAGARLREAQTKTLQLVPNTGMVVISDLVTDVHNIHPTNKIDVAERLANLALTKTYGKSGLPCEYPRFASMEKEKDKIRIQFSNAADGLVSRGGAPTEFYIAGSDQQFHPATARIEGSSVVVGSKEVKDPVAVRFGFSNTAIPNLFNKQGLPVDLFRTDDWDK